jgi:WhiB family redox-sensing transcriptional regulator
MTDTSRLPEPLLEHWEWQRLGACRSLDTALFFHPENERGPRRVAREAGAKAVCARCPVIAECRQHALAVREPYGVWGGLSESDRAELLLVDVPQEALVQAS